MGMLAKSVGLIAVVIMTALPVYAQQSQDQTKTTISPQQALDPATYAAAKELIAVTKSDQSIKQLLPTLSKNFTAIITRDNPQKADLVNKLMEQYFIPVFISHLDEFQDQMAAIYAEHLTADDMQQLITFYKGPAGQKYLQVMPAMGQESIQLGMAWGRKIGNEAAQQLATQLKKNNMNVPKEIGL